MTYSCTTDKGNVPQEFLPRNSGRLQASRMFQVDNWHIELFLSGNNRVGNRIIAVGVGDIDTSEFGWASFGSFFDRHLVEA